MYELEGIKRILIQGINFVRENIYNVNPEQVQYIIYNPTANHNTQKELKWNANNN